MKSLRTVSILLLALLFCLMPLCTLADEYRASGQIYITVEEDENGTRYQTITYKNGLEHKDDDNPVIWGETHNTIFINAPLFSDWVYVTLRDLTVNVKNGSSPIIVAGDGVVTIELDGDNTLINSTNGGGAGLQKDNSDLLNILDKNDTPGSLTAVGSAGGAGIGGVASCGHGENDVRGIYIEGGTITAIGGGSDYAFGCGAGIGGGGAGGDADIIYILNASVTAIGGTSPDGTVGGAGIGGGSQGSASNIIIGRSTVVAVGGGSAPEIPGEGNPDPNAGGAWAIGNGTGGTREMISVSECVMAIRPTNPNFSDPSVTIYPYGCDEGMHFPGMYVRENEVEATETTPGSYDEVIYCIFCHEELVRRSHSVQRVHRTDAQNHAAIQGFSARIAQTILDAPQNGTVVVDASIWSGFHRSVFEALSERSDVTLQAACLVNGAPTDLTFPAGRDYMAYIGDAFMLKFPRIAELLG